LESSSFTLKKVSQMSLLDALSAEKPEKLTPAEITMVSEEMIAN
jgi:hypothetical protein